MSILGVKLPRKPGKPEGKGRKELSMAERKAPPIGLIPRYLWIEQRVEEIQMAMLRYHVP
jgi:hypothetical protein